MAAGAGTLCDAFVAAMTSVDCVCAAGAPRPRGPEAPRPRRPVLSGFNHRSVGSGGHLKCLEARQSSTCRPGDSLRPSRACGGAQRGSPWAFRGKPLCDRVGLAGRADVVQQVARSLNDRKLSDHARLAHEMVRIELVRKFGKHRRDSGWPKVPVPSTQ
jgi:hypothetical protein